MRRRWIGTALVAAVVAPLVAGGCAQKSMYSWGAYEDSLYVMWNRPGSFDLGDRMRMLTEDVERDRAAGRTPPPGVQAHLGYLHLLAGDAATARSWFGVEKASYPESAAFMDRLMTQGAKP